MDVGIIVKIRQEGWELKWVAKKSFNLTCDLTSKWFSELAFGKVNENAKDPIHECCISNKGIEFKLKKHTVKKFRTELVILRLFFIGWSPLRLKSVPQDVFSACMHMLYWRRWRTKLQIHDYSSCKIYRSIELMIRPRWQFFELH